MAKTRLKTGERKTSVTREAVQKAVATIYITNIMKDIIDFILHGENIRLTSYQDSGGVWTIGIGSTFYEDGRKVREGETITREVAFALCAHFARDFMAHVQNHVKKPINHNQLMALTSFCYNIGKTAFLNSKVLKMINQDPNNYQIRDQFIKSFITAEGKPVKGLVNRRISEAHKYFTSSNI